MHCYNIVIVKQIHCIEPLHRPIYGLGMYLYNCSTHYSRTLRHNTKLPIVVNNLTIKLYLFIVDLGICTSVNREMTRATNENISENSENSPSSADWFPTHQLCCQYLIVPNNSWTRCAMYLDTVHIYFKKLPIKFCDFHSSAFYHNLFNSVKSEVWNIALQTRRPYSHCITKSLTSKNAYGISPPLYNKVAKN